METTAKVSDLIAKTSIVTLICPYEQWDNPIASDLFQKTVSMKRRGYGAVYPNGVLPVNTYDFVGTHHLICWREDRALRPICGYRSITLQRCQHHNLPFPASAYLEAAGATSQLTLLTEILDQYRQAPGQVAYDGSWTIESDIREFREYRDFVFDLMAAEMLHSFYAHGLREIIGCAVLKFRADEYFKAIGFQPFNKEGELLPEVRHPWLGRKKVIMIRLCEFSERARRLALLHQNLWQNRIIIGAHDGVRQKTCSSITSL